MCQLYYAAHTSVMVTILQNHEWTQICYITSFTLCTAFLNVIIFKILLVTSWIFFSLYFYDTSGCGFVRDWDFWCTVDAKLLQPGKEAVGLLPGDCTDRLCHQKSHTWWIVVGVTVHRIIFSPRYAIRAKQSSTSEPKANHCLSRSIF